jgi:hypothetical protein
MMPKKRPRAWRSGARLLPNVWDVNHGDFAMSPPLMLAVNRR